MDGGAIGWEAAIELESVGPLAIASLAPSRAISSNQVFRRVEDPKGIVFIDLPYWAESMLIHRFCI